MIKANLSALTFMEEKQDDLARKMLLRYFELLPEHKKIFSAPEREKKSLQDFKYHLHYLSNASLSDSPTLFVEYVSWARILFQNLHLPEKMLHASLKSMFDVLKAEMSSDDFGFVEESLIHALSHLESAYEVPDSFVTEHEHSSLAKKYVDLLLAGKRKEAVTFILDTVKQNKITIKDLYLKVFQQTQREIGLLWQTNEISVAQEHFATAVTQLIMAQLYPKIFVTEKTGYTMVATCIADELHEMGVRMVADFFEMEGWDTYYVGANVPVESILATLREKAPHILAISATMTFHIREVQRLISMIRALPEFNNTKIMVGGYPFLIDGLLWKKVGADGFAPDAQEAIAVASSLVEEHLHE